MLQSHQLDQSMQRAVGFRPVVSSSKSGWSRVALYNWKGHLDELTLDASESPVLSLHVGGVASAGVRIGRAQPAQLSRPGLLTFVPPAEAVRCDVNGNIRSITVHFDPECFERIGEETSIYRCARELRFKCGFQDELLAAAVHALADEVVDPSGMGSIYADCIAQSAVLRLVRITGRKASIPGNGLSRRALRTALELIESSIERGVSLEELARSVNLCRTHFAKAFSRSTGHAPHRYLTLRRVALARYLLAESQDSISDIAIRCGFSSQTHFSQYFRLYVGCTPLVYRTQTAANE